MAFFGGCHCLGDRRQNSILYSILKNDNQTEQHAPRRPGVVLQQQACSCGSKKKVALRCPQITCKAASAVLIWRGYSVYTTSTDCRAKRTRHLMNMSK
ncbi:hypothetical protein AAFF_G00210910 [Aldrovandia affinis]|uniref:Uncharacterized protein n=1 Tax=Aldrovandia affinis TaxID=143900 RepID=A0AAD7SWP9_9TELE|nr:hypothetical protein AAFF_G00210910 [Aldrovandia affinis]